MYNHPNLGGPITFNLYPKCKASLDDRNELNGENAYKKFFSISDVEKIEELKEIPTILIVSSKSKLAFLATNNIFGLKKVFDFDAYSVVNASSLKLPTKK